MVKFLVAKLLNHIKPSVLENQDSCNITPTKQPINVEANTATSAEKKRIKMINEQNILKSKILVWIVFCLNGRSTWNKNKPKNIATSAKPKPNVSGLWINPPNNAPAIVAKIQLR